MNSTTDNKSVSLRTILLISFTIQALGLAVFYSFDALRTSHLKAETEDVHRLNREAEIRLRKLEEQKAKKRERTGLKEEDARTMTKKAEQEKAKQITDKLHQMKTIREELKKAAEITTKELAKRSAENLGMYFYYQIQPLSTQLASQVVNQNNVVSLPSAPLVMNDGKTLHQIVETEKADLIQPDILEKLRTTHRQLRDDQKNLHEQRVIAQLSYTNDVKRIKQENHVMYLVSRTSDQMNELLKNTEALDLKAMNALPTDVIPPELSPDWEQTLEAMTIPELHAEAASLFDDIEELFSTARAADTALTEHTSFAKARENIDIPRPESKFQPDSLSNPPTTVGELSAYTEGLKAAVQDVNRLWQSAHNMGQAGQNMAGMNQPSDRDGKESDRRGEKSDSQGKAGQPGETSGRAANRKAAASQAAEGRLGRYADMTPFMYQRGEGAQQDGGAGGGSDITHKSQLTGYSETVTGTEKAPPKRAPSLSEDKVLKEALPGRKFSRNSKRTGWLYIDTWYVIGPWENNGRLNIEQTFPPETLIDLDAEYIGKKGSTLGWRFHQSDNIRIKPPDEREQSTYYGYTEVYFEEETVMLVAVASDDVAKVWLNGLVIWQDTGLSQWRLDEGFRNVIFKQGFNTILVRIDNGPITCTYSLLLCPPDAITH
jgi:hypothetical protein